MSTPPNSDPRLEQAAATDESLLAAHEKLLGKKTDDKANYRLLPLNLLFVFSGLIFFSGTYLNLYSGHFDPHIYNEHALPHSGAAEVAKVDPRELGKKLFNNAACNTCHQATGLGVPGVYPPLAGSEWVTGSEEHVIRILLYGLQGPVTVKGTAFPGTVQMPAFGKVAGSGFNWSDDKIAAVLTYVRSEWGNNASAITAEKVAEIHAKEADRKPWTVDELSKLP
jgi:mono/diheme cytochrome c family protein